MLALAATSASHMENHHGNTKAAGFAMIQPVITEIPTTTEPPTTTTTQPETWSVSSTSYCQSGTTASGKRTYVGEVAGNIWPLGTKLKILSGEHAGEIVTVEDRIGAHSQLDFFTWSCADAWKYGREQIKVEELG